MKKRILAIFLSAALLLGGCTTPVTPVGPADSTPSTQESLPSKEETLKEESSAEEQVSEETSEETSSEEVSSEAETEKEEETSSLPEKPKKTELVSSDYKYTYFIRINRALNTATIYQKGADGKFSEPVKAIAVSCGGENTPIGFFNLIGKHRWRLMVDDVYAQYASRVTGHILIHSVPYYTEDAGDLCYKQFNKLGKTASHGCIRMACADAKWVFDNCAVGTPVEIYDNYNKSGPLGKPTVQKIPTSGTYAHWDPTDPAEENPWNNRTPPTVIGASDRVLQLGEKFDPLKGVTAADAFENDLTADITVDGVVDTEKAGDYTLIYTVSDLPGNQTVIEVTVTVKESDVPSEPEIPSKPEDTVPPEIVADTSAFEASDKEAGIAFIRDRITVEDASGIAAADIQITEGSMQMLDYPDENGDPIGTVWVYHYDVTVTAADTCGNTAVKTLQFTFTVMELFAAA